MTFVRVRLVSVLVARGHPSCHRASLLPVDVLVARFRPCCNASGGVVAFNNQLQPNTAKKFKIKVGFAKYCS
jgi:hypothetical protein